MTGKTTHAEKATAAVCWDNSRNYMMAGDEFTGVVVGKDATGGAYVIANGVSAMGPGDAAHRQPSVSHFMKNAADAQACLISCIFPGERAEEFMAETSRQNMEDQPDPTLIEERFGVVYL